MPARLADRQIRAAAAFAAPTLDVRGPVSEALGRAGITVPPAEPGPEAEAAPAPDPARSLGRPAVPGLAPTVKPFEEAAWPTRRPASGSGDPLSGLTADERRVHQILLDALALDSQQGLGNGTGVVGLSYLENKKLKALDLAFINAELAKMAERQTQAGEAGRLGLLATLFLGPIALGIALIAGAGIEAALIALGVLGAVSAGLLAQSAAVPASAQRRKIYQALRELALLVDDAPVSEAVAQADALIDRLAEADAPSGADRPARTRLRS